MKSEQTTQRFTNKSRRLVIFIFTDKKGNLLLGLNKKAQQRLTNSIEYLVKRLLGNDDTAVRRVQGLLHLLGLHGEVSLKVPSQSNR